MYIALPIISVIIFLLIHRRSISITRPDLLTAVFVRDYIIFASLGYLYFSNPINFDSHYILERLPSTDGLQFAVISAFYFISIFIIFFNIFMYFGKLFIKSRNTKLGIVKNYLIFLSLFSYIVFALLLHATLSYDTGLNSLLSGENTRQLSEARAIITHSGGYLSFIRFLAATWGPMLGFAWLYLWLTEKESFGLPYKATAILALLFSFLSVFLTLQKANAAYFIFGLVGVWIYSGRRISIISWAIIISSSILTIIFAYIMTYQTKIVDNQYLIDIFIHRSVTQSVGSIVAFTLYPDFLDFKGLTGISNFLAGLVGGHFSSPYSDMIKYMVPETADVSGALSSFATGEAYALFGVPGVLISPVIAAAYFGFLESTRSNRGARLVWSPLYAQFYSVPYLSAGFYPFFWPVGFALSMLPFGAIWFLAKLAQERSR